MHRHQTILNGAHSEGAKPLMDLPAELPDDIDYDWYINESNDILKAIGHYEYDDIAF